MSEYKSIKLGVYDELRERCAFYERTNAEQAAILNRVTVERDAAIKVIDKHLELATEQALLNKALAEKLVEANKCIGLLTMKEPDLKAWWETTRATDKVRMECETKLAAVTAERDEYRAALEGLHDDVAEYCAINKLGGADNHWMRIAREALAKHSPEDEIERARRLIG